MDTIPVIDLAPMLAGRADGIAAVAADIGRACRSIGFFYLRNHGIPDALMAEIYAASAKLFALPVSDKEQLSLTRSGNNRGYAGFGTESLDPSKRADAKEAFNIGREPNPDEVVDSSQPSQGANQWPALPGFRETALRYYAGMRGLCEHLHMAIAVDLGLPPGYFSPFVDRPLATLRLLRYPPHPETFDGTRYGAGPHTDYGNVTILSQDDTGGLEVRTRTGEWIAAPPIPGAFVCNIGDCLMRWSNDIYVSTPHRVVNLARRERYSVAFFFDPNPDALIECLPTCSGPDRPARYPAITALEHLRERLDATYAHRQPALGA